MKIIYDRVYNMGTDLRTEYFESEGLKEMRVHAGPTFEFVD
ncbi:MAG: hypothetical protein WBB45_12035 [Cyclobacteriaceae bacterium]